MNLTAANTAIVLDSTADLPEAPERFPNVRIVPLYVRFGDESLRDGVDIRPDEFYARLAAAPELPTTSQPSPGDFLAVYEELGGYERILSLQLSSTLSGTFASAEAAAAALGDDRVRAVDTGSISAAVGLLVLAVQRRLARGTSDEEIDALVEAFRARHRILFTVDTLEYLQRGGRIGRAAALAGSLLQVRPVLAIQDGEVLPLRRVRGSGKALAAFRELLEAETVDAPSLRIGLAHAAAPERLEALRRLVEEARPNASIEIATGLGAVVGTHAGPGTVGLFWFDDPD
ncbi:MAG TPA: DegV family protein [Gaiellaceae bacterium]